VSVEKHQDYNKEMLGDIMQHWKNFEGHLFFVGQQWTLRYCQILLKVVESSKTMLKNVGQHQGNVKKC
jgi:hypothetical protein